LAQSYGVIACTPHPGLGTVAIQRPAVVQVVDLATCRRRTTPALKPSPSLRSPNGRLTATVRVSGHGMATKQSIIVNGRVIYTTRVFGDTSGLESPGPIELKRWSGDNRWIFFAIDPASSQSIAADGLILRVVSAASGPVHEIAAMLVYRDYTAWCGDRLVLTAGTGREATVNKELDVAAPPDWKTHPLTALRNRAWGSIACAPDNRSVVVQSQPKAQFAGFFSTHWQLWRVRLDGKATQLTRPPAKHADESPRFSPDGKTIYFVRSKHGIGQLYALRAGKLTGPLLSLGYSLGYYGANSWPYTVRR
jgi:dipeptidyl aminopeptidase/acylaminoacyl peptidase